ncbi:MAG: hypothetical protein JSS75_07715 [Bacteroidetes bacterium]|nr:hypothetical protein [Bacteroidota bacterium]
MNQRSFVTRLGAVALALVFMLSISSCGNSGSSPNNPTTGSNDYGGNTFPKTGTTYTYDLYQTDSVGTKVVGTDTTIVASVVGAGMTYLGESNVFAVQDGGTTNHFTFTHAGDLKMSPDTAGITAMLNGIANASIAKWFTFLTGTKLAGDFHAFDTSISFPFTFNGLPIQVGVDISIANGYMKEEAVQVGSESLQCSKIHIKYTVDIHAVIVNSTIIIDNTYWFSPKIGYFAKEVSTNTGLDILGMPPSGSVQTLTSYHLN